MRAAILEDAGRIVVKEVPKPSPTENEVLVRVKYCGICGSDLHAYKTGMYGLGLTMGHEFSGDRVELGVDVKGWNVGDRVIKKPESCGECYYCRRGLTNLCEKGVEYGIGIFSPGAYAEYVVVPAGGLYKLPEELTYEQGTMVDPLSTPVRAVRLSKMKLGDTALVLGAGPLGLLTLQCAKLAGANAVYVTEKAKKRMALAKKLGADEVLNPDEVDICSRILEITDNHGSDVVFECVGLPNTMQDAMRTVGNAGKILIEGIFEEDVETRFLDVVLNEIGIKGVWSYDENDFRCAVELIRKKSVDVDSIITDIIPLNDISKKGFEALTKPEKESAKVLVAP